MTIDWARLGRAVKQRREQLGLSQDSVHQAGGPSDVVVARIESNEPPRPSKGSIRKLDVGLRWAPGSAQRVLNGGEPAALERPPDLHQVSIDALLGEVRRRVVDAERRGVQHVVGDESKPAWVWKKPPREGDEGLSDWVPSQM